MRFAIRREPFEQWGRLNVIPSERSESGDLPCGHRSQPRHEYFTLDPSTRWRSLGMTPGCRPPFGRAAPVVFLQCRNFDPPIFVVPE
jgi:hypothetical protein